MAATITIRETVAKSILVRSRLPGVDFAANPYTGCAHACVYCYASYMARRSQQTGQWGSFVDVKTWPPLKSSKRLAGKTILISSATDAWQPVEAEYGRTRLLLEQLYGSGCKLTILTKSDLILRDLDLLKGFNDLAVFWSINTTEDTIRMDRATTVSGRLEAMRLFHEARIRTGCFIAPVMPGLTDINAIRQRCTPFCDIFWQDRLNLRQNNRAVVLDFIKRNHPQLFPLYSRIQLSGRQPNGQSSAQH